MCINRKSEQIKAIIITHMYGNAAKFEKLYKTLKKNIKIVEDSAESFGTKYKSYFKDRHTGSIGDIVFLLMEIK